ncbi:MAG: hypothetical protein CMC83_02430 [Flavobacteriaceae bacterium]|nr:hypothetical protein [Flavobacteriaceae bacterium]
MSNLKFFLSSLFICFLFSCDKNNVTKKIKKENIKIAAERDSKKLSASISFDKTIHDFGEIQNGTPVKTVFSYTNTGNSALVVSDIKGKCGCTVPTGWKKEPLMPGESSQFTVEFNGKGANKVSKTVRMTSNIGEHDVEITAFIKPDPKASQLKKIN